MNVEIPLLVPPIRKNKTDPSFWKTDSLAFFEQLTFVTCLQTQGHNSCWKLFTSACTGPRTTLQTAFRLNAIFLQINRKCELASCADVYLSIEESNEWSSHRFVQGEVDCRAEGQNNRHEQTIPQRSHTLRADNLEQPIWKTDDKCQFSGRKNWILRLRPSDNGEQEAVQTHWVRRPPRNRSLENMPPPLVENGDVDLPKPWNMHMPALMSCKPQRLPIMSSFLDIMLWCCHPRGVHFRGVEAWRLPMTPW